MPVAGERLRVQRRHLRVSQGLEVERFRCVFWGEFRVLVGLYKVYRVYVGFREGLGEGGGETSKRPKPLVYFGSRWQLALRLLGGAQKLCLPNIVCRLLGGFRWPTALPGMLRMCIGERSERHV